MDKIEIIFKNTSLNNFLKSVAAFSDRVIFEEKNNQLIATTFVDQCIYRGIYKNVRSMGGNYSFHYCHRTLCVSIAVPPAHISQVGAEKL